MGNQGLVIDTDVIVGYLRGRDDTLTGLFEDKKLLYVSAVTAFELAYGAIKSKKPDAFKSLLKLLAYFTVLDFGGPEALKSAKVKRDLEKAGLPIDIRDTFIAATCLVNNLPLLTKNLKHFQRIKGLVLYRTSNNS